MNVNGILFDTANIDRLLYCSGEAVPGEVTQKKNMAAEGRNRKALGDIGNVATDRGVEGKKPLPQVSRPLKRSFLGNHNF